VRNLERELAKLCRKAITKIVKKEEEAVTVTAADLDEFLGVRRFKYGLAEETDQIGVTTGLAWTEVGGDLLSIEALRLPGKGRMKTTGKPRLASSHRSLRRSIFTCTCLTGRPRRMGRLPVLRWSRRSCRS